MIMIFYLIRERKDRQGASAACGKKPREGPRLADKDTTYSVPTRKRKDNAPIHPSTHGPTRPRGGQRSGQLRASRGQLTSPTRFGAVQQPGRTSQQQPPAAARSLPTRTQPSRGDPPPTVHSSHHHPVTILALPFFPSKNRGTPAHPTSYPRRR